MKRISVSWSLFLILALTLLAGCASSSGSNTTVALSADNINLVFVVSPEVSNVLCEGIDSTALPDTAPPF